MPEWQTNSATSGKERKNFGKYLHTYYWGTTFQRIHHFRKKFKKKFWGNFRRVVGKLLGKPFSERQKT